MISVVLLALVANTYFIQPDYCLQWATLDITVVVESRSTLLVKPAKWMAVRKSGILTLGITRNAFINSTICKRPRDRLIQ